MYLVGFAVLMVALLAIFGVASYFAVLIVLVLAPCAWFFLAG